jgi:hypothetical protein
MARKSLRLLTLMTLIGITLIGTSLLSAGVQSRQKQPQKDAEEVGHILRQKTLREAAQERDIEITAYPEWPEYYELSSMVSNSHTIVVGQIKTAEPAFTKSGDHITTKFSVEVRRVLKVDAPIEFPLEFARYGGAVQVNGHRASVKVRGSEKLKVGGDYVLFLEWSPKRQGYILSGDLSGAFRIENNSQVYSLASSERNEIRIKYNGTDLFEFISQVLTRQ